LLGYFPKFVLGGLLIYLGADTLHKWIVQSRRRLSLTEYLSLLVIIAIILQWGFIAGILIGVVISCTTFALSASRIDAIEFGFDGSEYRSSLDRSRDDQAVLSAHGGKIQGLNMAARRGCAASAVTPPSAKWVWSRTPRAARPFRPRSQAFSMS
jgi:sulfate permease, SulP family